MWNLQECHFGNTFSQRIIFKDGGKQGNSLKSLSLKRIAAIVIVHLQKLGSSSLRWWLSVGWWSGEIIETISRSAVHSVKIPRTPSKIVVVWEVIECSFVVHLRPINGIAIVIGVILIVAKLGCVSSSISSSQRVLCFWSDRTCSWWRQFIILMLRCMRRATSCYSCSFSKLAKILSIPSVILSLLHVLSPVLLSCLVLKASHSMRRVLRRGAQTVTFNFKLLLIVRLLLETLLSGYFHKLHSLHLWHIFNVSQWSPSLELLTSEFSLPLRVATIFEGKWRHIVRISIDRRHRLIVNFRSHWVIAVLQRFRTHDLMRMLLLSWSQQARVFILQFTVHHLKIASFELLFSEPSLQSLDVLLVVQFLEL